MSDQAHRLVETLSLQELFELILHRKKWLIVTTGLALILGAGYLWWKTPVYYVQALLQVEQNAQVVPGVRDFEEVLSGQPQSTTEIELLKSRQVLDAAVEELRLNEKAVPVRFPYIGRYWAKFHRLLGTGREQSIASPPLGLFSEYGWGGESASLARLEVPAAWIGSSFEIIIQGDGGYQVYSPGGTYLGAGEVGSTFISRHESLAGEMLVMSIESLRARPGTRFRLTKLHPSVISQQIQQNLWILEKGRDSGILAVVVKSTRPEQDEKMINSIMDIYVRQNLELRSKEASQSLEFVESQLPLVRRSTEAAEERLNEFKNANLAVDLNTETRGILNRLVEIEKALGQFDVQRAELREVYTADHPSIQSLDAKASELRRTQAKIELELSELPETQQEIARLERDSDVNNGIYTFLLNKAQTLKIVEAGTVGSARVVDYALTSFTPIAPKPGKVLGLAFVFGLLSGIILVFVKFTFRNTVEGAEDIERRLGKSVYAVVPYSRVQEKRTSEAKNKNKPNLLAETDQDPSAAEALRSLRAATHFAFAGESNSVLLITGPTEAVGKSFISANLAFLQASAGTKCLLVDADLRKGSLHRYLGKQRELGLADYLAGDRELDEIICETHVDSLSFISTGRIPPNPSELLMSSAMTAAIEQFQSRFDLVIIDSPPVLPVADASLLARMVGRCFLVVRAGKTKNMELDECIKRLERHEETVVAGVVINGMRKQSMGYRYYYDYNY